MINCYRDHPIVRLYNYDRYMIIHMTGLYTRLVSYARLYILTLLVFFYHDIRYISFTALFLILIIFVIFYSLSHCYCLHCYYARTPSSLHIHSLGRFWRPWIRMSRVLDIFLCYSGVRVIVRFVRSWSFSLFDFGILAFLYFCYYSLIPMYHT